MSPEDNDEGGVFEIPPKEPPTEALIRWRQATLVLNATRRFRYTANVKAEIEREQQQQELSPKILSPTSRFRTSGRALMAIQRFKRAGQQRAQRMAFKDDFGDGFGVTQEQLNTILEESNIENLKSSGGVAGVARALRVDPDKGVDATEEEMQKRKDEFGTNTYPEQPQKSILMFMWEASKDTTLIILMACAAVSLIAGMITEPADQGWYDGAAIGFAVILVIFVTAFSDYRQSLQFRGLNAEKSDIQLQVLRSGRRQTVSIFTLVVGDVVPLAIGDQVPGDGLLLSGHGLTIDESSMTGESDPMHKDAARPFLLSGCKVVDGFGYMIVTGVGTNTEWGRVMATLSEDEDSETPLQVRLNGVATSIGKAGLAVAALVLVILLIRYFANYQPKAPLKVVKDIVDIFSIAVTIVVVAVPEGLPLAVTLTLAYSMRKMMNDKALVRHLAACETMGSATTICSDKTGTLTQNQMTVVQVWCAGESRDAASRGGIAETVFTDMFEGVSHNSTGSVFLPPDGGPPEVTASPTESAIITWALKMGMNFDGARASSAILVAEPFNSTKKRSQVAVKRPSGDVLIHWSGAAEIIVENSSHWVTSSGTSQPMTESKLKEIYSSIETMAADSLRCVAIASTYLPPSDHPPNPIPDDWKLPDVKLTLLAILGLKDPCRPGVPAAVAICQSAGVKVRMVTGDNQLTARAIASECGILTPDGVVIEGKDFRALTKEQMMDVIPRIDVMARSSPSDKHTLVKMLRAMGEVVGVTGDGTNDAPALHEADIGLSMGLSGTEVAKEASDIVILDDNFASIVKVVRWGRSVYANIQKFIQFQLTVNVVALILNFVAACSSGDVPLTAVQLLWVNLIMDTLGALALATEMPTDRLLAQKPVGRKSPLITNIMWRNIFGQAAYQLAVLMTLNYAGQDILNLHGKPDPDLTNKTIIFNAFVLCQLFNEINSRKPDEINVFSGLFTNPFFMGVLALSAAFQVVIVEVLHKFASTVSLTWEQWVICLVIGFISMPLAVIIKLIRVPEEPPLFDFIVKKKGKSGSKGSRPSSSHGAGEENGEPSPYEEVPSTKRLVLGCLSSENGDA